MRADPKRPNVLFLVTDDLRPELGCYGSEIAVTPNLDTLASEGVVFDRAYCQQAVCNPSRTSFLTGLRPDTVRVWDLDGRFRETNKDATSIPEYFKRNGYFTESIGKIFHNESVPKPNRAPMADPPSWSVPAILTTGPHWKDWVVPGNPFGADSKQGAWQGLDVQDEAYFDGQIAANACSAIKELAKRDQPFFLAVGFWKPHLPFNAPKRYWDLYDPTVFDQIPSSSFPEGAPEVARHHWKELRSYKGMPAEGAVTEDQARMLRHGYFACISFLDAQIGKVLDQLRESGLEDNTIVVFLADHGFHLGEQDLWAKTSNYELDARVPLLVVDPRIKDAGKHATGFVELVDLFPSLVDLAGLPRLDGLDGSSFTHLLRDPSLDGKPYVLSQHPQPFYSKDWKAMGYAIRDPRYRYVEWKDIHTGEIIARELYDHEKDPQELQNRADDPRYGDVLRSMEAISAEHFHFSPDMIASEF